MKLIQSFASIILLSGITLTACDNIETAETDNTSDEVSFDGSCGNQNDTYVRQDKYTYYKSSSGVDMEVYLPREEKNIDVAIIACPGGAYSSHASHEGAVWAPYFNDLGIAFAVLKYTLPDGDPSKPVGDMKTALTILHKMADKWLIDKNKIGVMGFSAGGHLACYSATTSDFDPSIRPDFQVLIYPVITFMNGTHGGSRDNFLGAGSTSDEQKLYSNELWVNSDTPKAFISFAKSETVVPPATNGQAFYDAMIRAGASAEILPLEGDKHGWHHSNSAHVTQYLEPLKEKLTPWLFGL